MLLIHFKLLKMIG
ncbi:hypothetical protein ECEC4402_2192, partial [Escherichia coli EC4402]